MSLRDLVTDAAQGTPPAAFTGLYLLGVPLQTWVVVLNFVWILLLIGHKVHQILKEGKNGSK